jgi:flagellar basal-body rod protein FlgB
MLEKLSLFTMASALARHSAARHRVIAENVANADTPGYRARDVAPFSVRVNEAFTQRATRAGHLGARPPGIPPAPEIVALTAGASPNGNTVTLEDQSLRAVEAQGRHALALSVYSKSVDILRLGIGRNR